MSLKFAIGFGRDPRPGVAERDGFFFYSTSLLALISYFCNFLLFRREGHGRESTGLRGSTAGSGGARTFPVVGARGC